MCRDGAYYSNLIQFSLYLSINRIMGAVMNQLTNKTVRYIKNCWGLDDSGECDHIVMLWCSGFYEEAAYMLMEAGAFSFGAGDTPTQVAKEVKANYKKKNRGEVENAIDECLSNDGDYRIYYCIHCDHVHFINSLYYDDAKDWTCDGCSKRGLHIKATVDDKVAQS